MPIMNLTGPQGSTGSTGAAGKGISSTVITYQAGSSGTTAPTGSWVANPPATSVGQFLWTRTIISFTDSTSTTAYSVAAHGATGSTGSTGATGKGVSSAVVTYQAASSGTTTPTGSWVGSPPATTVGQFLWTRTVITWTDSTTTTSYSVAAHGATGSQGIQGPQGDTFTDICDTSLNLASILGTTQEVSVTKPHIWVVGMRLRFVADADPTKWFEGVYASQTGEPGGLGNVAVDTVNGIGTIDDWNVYLTGEAGSVWHSGSGVPSGSLGRNGDFYLRTSNGDVYKKVGGSWT